MDFKTCCKKLNIEKYTERIFNSNSHGELFHIYDYFIILEIAEKHPSFAKLFPIWFDNIVMWAEKNWKRPESVFQHILTLLKKELVQ